MIEEKVRSILVEELEEELHVEAEKITNDDNLFLLGVDSLNIIKVVLAIEENFDIELDENELVITNLETISKISELIKKKI